MHFLQICDFINAQFFLSSLLLLTVSPDGVGVLKHIFCFENIWAVHAFHLKVNYSDIRCA